MKRIIKTREFKIWQLEQITGLQNKMGHNINSMQREIVRNGKEKAEVQKQGGGSGTFQKEHNRTLILLLSNYFIYSSTCLHW